MVYKDFIFILSISVYIAMAVFLFIYLYFYKSNILYLSFHKAENEKKSSIDKMLNRIEKIHIHRLWYFILGGKEIEEYLKFGGLKFNFKTQHFLVLKKITIIMGLILFISIMIYFTNINYFFKLSIGVPILYISMFWPEIYLKRHILKKQREIIRELPNVIELIRLQINAGANLEIAFHSLANYLNSSLGDEIKEFVFLLDNGITFMDAIEKTAERLKIDDFNNLVLVFKQSKELGVSLGDTLAIQSEMLRTKRRQKAEELGRTASIKVSIPLVTLIFPAMLIVYISPAILRLLDL